MHDLVGAYERLKRVYGQYIESAFPLRYRAIANARRKLLSDSDVLSQPPLLEPTPVYPSSGRTLTQAAAVLPSCYRDMPKLARELMGENVQLYSHQLRSLEAVLRDGKDLVVTTGTGSGKTECFLIPVLAELARESRSWPQSSNSPRVRRWWEDEHSGWRGQWNHTSRNAEGLHAIRAIALYPLNALVEDQLRRLRRTLDSESTHAWLDTERGGNRITFGRYTGQTPVPGVPSRRAPLRRLRSRLRTVAAESDAVRAESGLAEDVRYYFPNIDGGEMWSRWDMQDTPPDILITNYSMLNIMLMRSVESGMFEKTREWLKSDEANKFFLIVDELHSYRGTPGTEIAYLLRLLLHRLGLNIESRQLVILSTSASVTDNEDSRTFLREFFGRDRFEVISESQTLPDENALKSVVRFQSAFEGFARDVQSDPLSSMAPQDPSLDRTKRAMKDLAVALGSPPSRDEEPAHTLANALSSASVKANDAIRAACLVRTETGGSQIRPKKVTDIDRILFGTRSSDIGISDAMRGLLLGLGMSRKSTDDTSPQPVRGHFFFHNVQNLWACANPDCNGQTHGGTRPGYGTQGPVGALHAEHRLTCTCGGRVLDLIVCEVCGDVFLGGYRSKTTVNGNQVEILTADLPDIADMPNRAFTGQRHDKYAVFWPANTVDPDAEPEDIEYSQNGMIRRWNRAKLNVSSGLLTQSAAPAKPGEIEGWTYVISGLDGHQQSALPAKCPRCDADYRRRTHYQSPLRVHRTGFQKACQVIAGALAREMPQLDGAGIPTRKLVIFSDSRQDAAKLASGMEQDHYRDMVRILMLKAMREYWSDFEAALRIACAKVPGATERIGDINSELRNDISEVERPIDQRLAAQFDETLNNQLLLWLIGAPSTNPEALRLLQSMIEDYPGRVPLTAIRDRVKVEMLRMGLNPGGNSYNLSHFTDAGKWHDWHTCFDWEQTVPQERPQLPPDANRLMQSIDDSLMNELMFTLFQHSARTLEGMGVGWASFRPDGSTPEEVLLATESLIRMLGVRRRYKGQDHFFEEGRITADGVSLPSYASRYLDSIGVSERAVINQLKASDLGVIGNSGLGLDPNRLYIIRGPLGNASGQKKGWRCEKCNAFYLHPTGQTSICPDCLDQRLVESATQEDLDYYTYLAEQSGDPFRLHCEELTGQTDDVDRSRRQRWFQEVFVADDTGLDRVHGVDLLSVTTTMEAGVDIGGLEAIMMANMPPRRFNYQQRVGRAGRRGEGVSLAVTFCRGRSHDDYYYQRPEQITGDPPPTPYVDVSHETGHEIVQRVFAKETFRLAFGGVSFDDDGFFDSVHGEFGPASKWDERKSLVQGWLKGPSNESVLVAVIDSLRVGTAWADGTGRVDEFRRQMLDYVRDLLIDRVSDVASDDTRFNQDALSERVAHAGLLPMFGFPTDARLLYTNLPRSTNPWPPRRGTIDRDLSIAIGQFAPESQTVKDKSVHTAFGVAQFYPSGSRIRTGAGFEPPLPERNPTLLGICDLCKGVQYISSDSAEDCHVCLNPLDGVDAREPKGFFTDFSPQDYDGVFEWTPRSTIPTLAWEGPPDHEGTVGNCRASTLSSHVISVNDNGGKGGFEFQKATIGYSNVSGEEAYAVNPGATRNVSVSGEKYLVALLSRKKTDVLLAGIDDWPEGIFADPLSPVGRAAWFSFAFFLRSSAAALMDVDTLEFSAGFRPIQERGKAVGQAFLSDTLQNGAGYCWWLGKPQNFHQLLSHGNSATDSSNAQMWTDRAHSEDCDTSCNRCLRDFYNLAYHGLLDWRLAIDMARLASDAGATIDLTSPWPELGRNPWRTLCDGDSAPIRATLASLAYDRYERFGDLTGYVSRRGSVKLLRHPLWTDEHPNYQAAMKDALMRYPGHVIGAINPFEVTRRPSDILSPTA